MGTAADRRECGGDYVTPADVEYFWFNPDRQFRIRQLSPGNRRTFVLVHRACGVLEQFTSDDRRIMWFGDFDCEDLLRLIAEERAWRAMENRNDE